MKVLFLCLVWPEPESSAAGVRLDHLIRLFHKEGYEIHLSSTAERGPHSALYEDLKGVYRHSLDPNSAETNDKLAQINPNVVIFDRYPSEEQFSWQLMEVCPKAIRVLDTEDLHGLRRARQLSLEAMDQKERDNHIYVDDQLLSSSTVYNTIALREMISMHRSDLSLVVSDVELSYAQKHYAIPTNQLLYMPILSSRTTGKNDWVRSQEPMNAFFIGNFRHAPNRDAVQFLRYYLWPSIHQSLNDRGLHGIECHIYGAYMDAEMERLHDPSINFHMKGRVDDVFSIMATYQVLLAPLRFGAGVKGKILDALWADLPIITTPIGSEGLSVHLDGAEFPGYVARTVAEFKKAAVQHLSSTAIRVHTSINKVSVKNRLDYEYGAKCLFQINDLLQSKHNICNPIQVMIQHNSQLAHRYLSKYIQLKNKT